MDLDASTWESDPTHATMPIFPDIMLEFCKRTDPRYKAIRDQHYVTNKGSSGQQIHFLIWYKREIVGIISGGSSVYAVGARDKFFNLTKENREKVLPSILHNTAYRLTNHEPNLATRVLALWRVIVPFVWFDLYAAVPCGFETFVGENGTRKGALYKADNWQFLGTTAGSAKSHKGLSAKQTRKNVEPKLVFARRSEDFSWMRGYGLPEFKSSWRGKTPEEKQRAKSIRQRREYLTGRVFFQHKVDGIKSVNFTRKEFVISD